jgi:epidermal growth factor receptor substrate 15
MICFLSMIHLRRPRLSIQRQGPFNLRLYSVRRLVILLRPHHLQIVRRITPRFMLILSSVFTAPHGDLLGDDDAASTTPPLHDQSAEIGNAKNHLKSTSQSLEATKNESASIQQTLATQASQLSALQTQLSSAKAAYETETKLLAAFKERHSAQSAEIQKAREDLIRAESDLSAIKVEKSEIEGSFLRDKEDIRELHRKMNEVGQQIDALKTDIEKAKKDAKQQKGLLAIAKKQLSLKEAEKAKAEKEQEGALADLTAVTKEREEAEADLAKEITEIEPKAVTDSAAFTASQQPLPLTPDLSATALGKSNNPFERLTKSSGNSTPRSQSPFLPFQSPNLSLSSARSGSIPGAFETEGHDDDIFTPIETANGSSLEPKDESQQPLKPEPAAVDSPTANETEFFSTPPTSATQVPSPTVAAAYFPSLDDAAVDFPSIDLPPAQNSQRDLETNFGTQLKELDVDDSDSDSDEIPLAELAQTNKKASPIVPKAVEELPVIGTPQVSFDDIFVSNTPIAADSSSPNKFPTVTANAPIASSPFEARSSPLQASAPTELSATSTTAGVSAFDEAMGKIPGTTSAAAPQFTFDTAFDDNFDFASASTAEASGPLPLPFTTDFKVTNGDTRKSQFSDMFSTIGSKKIHENHFTPSQSVVGAPSREPAQPLGTSFDETFPTFDLSPKTSLAMAEEAPSKSTESTAAGALPASPVSASPKASIPQSSDVRLGSPPPSEKSPPQRTASPKPRPSSSSSKEVHEKQKEPSTRHSKLSVSAFLLGYAMPIPPPRSVYLLVRGRNIKNRCLLLLRRRISRLCERSLPGLSPQLWTMTSRL